MKRLSSKLLAETIRSKREALKLSQEDLGKLTGINRVMIGRIEREDFIPSINQFEALAHVLNFDMTEMFVDSLENNSFVALLDQAVTKEDKEELDQLYTMMLTLRQQILLRRKFEGELYNNS